MPTAAALATLPPGRFRVQVRQAIARLNAEESATGGNSLADILFQTGLQTYQQAVMYELATAGIDPGYVRISNPAVVADIRQHAERVAMQVGTTWEHDLLEFLDSKDGGATPEEIAQWSVERDAWKVPQLALTEVAHGAGAAQREFIAQSQASGTATFGGSLRCDLCRGIASGNPYDINDSLVGDIPHPNCHDRWGLHTTKIASPWRGE